MVSFGVVNVLVNYLLPSPALLIENIYIKLKAAIGHSILCQQIKIDVSITNQLKHSAIG